MYVGFVVLVNAEVDSMGEVIDGGVGISSAPSPQQSSDLEKTQAELRQMFTAADKFRRELEFLQKGGDPLDLKTWSADQHPEQLVTRYCSEAKGSFAVAPSPHRGSGATSVCEANSADNLMLFDGDRRFRKVDRRSVAPRRNNNTLTEHYSQLDVGQNAKDLGDSSALELPKKSYKRRIRSRPNRDGARSSATDVIPSRGNQSFFPSCHASKDPKGLVVADNQEWSRLSNAKGKPKTPNARVGLKNGAIASHSDMELDDVQAMESTFGPAHGLSSAVSDANAPQNPQENQHDQLLKHEFVEGAGQADLASSELTLTTQRADLAFSGQTNGFGNTGTAPLTKGLVLKSSCTETYLSSDGNNVNELPASVTNGSNRRMEQNLVAKEIPAMEGNDLVPTKDDKILIIGNDNISPYRPTNNENGSAQKEEFFLKGSESDLQNELKNPVSTKGVDSDWCTASEIERKPSNVLKSDSFSQGGNASTGRPQGSNDTSFFESALSVRSITDVTDQNVGSPNNLKFGTKEYEDSILEEARIIEAKRKRISVLSAGTSPLDTRRRSHWDIVLEEMSWLANDFAQERLWKVTAAAQISRRVAFASQARFQQNKSLRKQKEMAHTLSVAVMEFWHTVQVKCKALESECPKTKSTLGLQGYALRFLEYNSCHAQYTAAQAPVTPDRMSDLGIKNNSWEDNLTEENLFYTVPPGAFEAYRKSIEFHLLQRERTGSSMQEEVDTSGYDAVAEDEGETSTYYLPGAFNSIRSSQTAQKKKNFKSYTARSYEIGADLMHMQSERKIAIRPSASSVKRPASSLNVSIPTKRVRTASRQRVLGPFNAGNSVIQVPNRTDASSGENSFQDEQSALHGEFRILNNMEAESVGDYEKQLQFDSTEVSYRPKKKKAKHLGSTFEYRWQLDSNFQNDQKEQSKRRLDTHQFDSNGSSVASQMSNMSNQNKFMDLLVRDRGRKPKALKTAAGKAGSGNAWSLFEDQALVVLVHDMGPNWELISDAINSTLQFKCIFRKSSECKERHKILIDKNSDEGAESGEDSGSSQPYPSTLPGIPEGSARQLFQRLQGPMDEDTLKSHFEKIIKIGQKQHYRRTQNDTQDPKQLQQPHSSHTLSLSQVCPNNLNGGPVLTPLELCDAIASSPDVLPVGYQGPPSGGLPIPSQGTVATILPGSSSSSSGPGSSSVALASTISSPSAPLNPSAREGRYGIPKTGSLSIDDQQRMQHYNRMLSARNLQQTLPPGSHIGTDRGIRMLSPGSGMMNRSTTMTRPGFQRIASQSVLNSGNMHSSGMPMPTPANMHSQGNSMLRPREPMHMMRPNQNTDHQRQIMQPDLQMQQGSQGGSTQGVPPFANVMNSSFPNQSYPRQHHLQAPSNHATNAQHPSHGIHFLKERQLQRQRLIQQQQFGTSNSMMPRGKPQSQLHISSPPNSTQIQSQSSPPLSVSQMGSPSIASIPQNLHKHPVPTSHGLVRNPPTSGNQMVKQQQRQSQQVVRNLQQSGQGNLHSNSSLNRSHHQKTFSSQMQAPSLKQLQQPKPSDSSDSSNYKNHTPSTSGKTSSDHHQPQPNQKLVNQSQETTSQRMVHNRLVNSMDLPTSKLKAEQPSRPTTVQMPKAPYNDATSSERPVSSAWRTTEPLYDSFSAMPDNAQQYSKNLMQKSPPKRGTGNENSGLTINHDVVHRQSSSESLPNPIGHDVGV